MVSVFDPFNDRLSRDIRNTLAEAFVDALAQKQPSGYRMVAQQWLTRQLAAEYQNYIQDRLTRYDGVLDQIAACRLDEARLQALIIWNHGLFFEFHDHLERIWQRTSGDEHQALKGLIKAAGVYIHMEHGHRQAAESLARKSLKLILTYSHHLQFITNLDILVENLKNPDSFPLKLDNPALGDG